MSEIGRVRQAREDVARAEEALEEARAALRDQMLEAQRAGYTIADLMERTGYSKRQVMNHLAAARSSA